MYFLHRSDENKIKWTGTAEHRLKKGLALEDVPASALFFFSGEN